MNFILRKSIDNQTITLKVLKTFSFLKIKKISFSFTLTVSKNVKKNTHITQKLLGAILQMFSSSLACMFQRNFRLVFCEYLMQVSVQM